MYLYIIKVLTLKIHLGSYSFLAKKIIVFSYFKQKFKNVLVPVLKYIPKY